MINKIDVLVAPEDNQSDMKLYELEYYKEVDSNSYDFYENLNEITDIVEKRLPGYVVVGIAPTKKPGKEDVFGNEIPTKKDTKHD